MSDSLLHPFMCFHLRRLTSFLLHHLICLYFFFQINRFDNEGKLAPWQKTSYQVKDRKGEQRSSFLASQMNFSGIFMSSSENKEVLLNLRGSLWLVVLMANLTRQIYLLRGVVFMVKCWDSAAAWPLVDQITNRKISPISLMNLSSH